MTLNTNIKTIIGAGAIGLALSAASTVQAATLTTTEIDFGSLSGNLSDFVIGDYFFTTLQLINSTTCAVPSCIQEATGQGAITTMSLVSGGTFSLESFYFSLQGSGPNASNDVSLISNTGETYSYALGDNDDNGAVGGDVFLYDNSTNSIGADLTNGAEIENSNGANGPNYVVIFGSEFEDVSSISWFSTDTANTRIDNITATTATTTPIPLPAAGWMLIASMGGLAAVRRRRKA